MTAAIPGMSLATSTDDPDELREPAGGAGLFDVDPDQQGVSQEPHVPVIGDVEALDEEMEL